ncbi:fibronectin type III domain-containing protein [Nocardioides halotolerans]|uniref:fibronectin type III domain-containing protein n=1 Tax=Nocardioides halotolerans TaxID=433660 RepID=UPI000A035FB8|nr:fibronectin type III domain-containing protein [Nocardioides halotolerans]
MRTRALTLTVLVLGALCAGAASATADDDGGGAPSLPHSAHGQQAIELLGDRLDEAAALSDWTPPQLREVLATDPTAWVDRDGRVFYKEVTALGDEPDAYDSADAPPFPLDQTFLLHSNPASTKKLFIDFDGTTVSGTRWNTNYALPNGSYPAWDPDGNGEAFTDGEKESIQTIWQRVSEDYAPFGVDVTTEDPGEAGLLRTNASDQAYGTRALVTPSTVAEGAICGTPVPSCGGVAYINVFGQTEPDGSSHQPAWVFPQSLSQNPKNIAEAVAHEVGHNFSLQHDGVTTASAQSVLPKCATVTGYYCGHAQWAPIMGVGYYKPVVQWSKGEYASANNTSQDDVSLIAGKAPYRADENDGTIPGAGVVLPTAAPARITTRTDTDTYLLGTCSGPVTVTATPWPLSPNLDIKLDLLTAGGAVQTSADPAATMVDTETASGLDAAISTSVPTGVYYARVDGVGIGTGATGYTDYASIGSYTLAATGCAILPPPPPVSAPGAPAVIKVAKGKKGGKKTASVAWAAPASTGGTPITGYRVTVLKAKNGKVVRTANVAAGVTSYVAKKLKSGKYRFAVVALNAVGASPQALSKAVRAR